MNDTAKQETESTGQQEVILFDKNQITEFDEFTSELAKLQEANKTLVFDYSDPKQYKAGVSHVAKLRTTKTTVEDRRKEVGKPARDYKKEVDKQGNGLLDELDKLIELHAKPRREYDKKQQLRKDAHEANMLVFTNYKSTFESGAEVDSVEIKALIKILMDLEIGETWEEYQEPARMAREAAFKDLKPRLEYRLQIEENNEKLAKLEKENEEREEREEEQRKANKKKLDDENEADEQRVRVITTKLSCFTRYMQFQLDDHDLEVFEAELECVQGFEVTDEIFQEFVDKAKLAKLECIAGLNKKITAKKDRIEEQERLQKLEDEKKERLENEQKEADEQAERDELAADETHRKEVNAAIREALLVVPDVTAGVADDIIDLLASGTVPNVTLTY